MSPIKTTMRLSKREIDTVKDALDIYKENLLRAGESYADKLAEVQKLHAMFKATSEHSFTNK